MGRSSPTHVPGQSRRRRKNHQDSKRNWDSHADHKLRSAVPPRLVKHFYDEWLGTNGVSHSWPFER
ncbi:hypothetical protein ALC62_00550 [Cyphomyrmex costatus]|uniref:Uncharacterized protein n=1 Tax=Cyphomyrmex costatus TaxID=456900 RepID=A0A151IQN4_9HYME|nr:hypothetical protein ALC62_00550 [Cyphomyrmex costatus]